MESAEDCPEKFREVAMWVHEAGIQIASLWQFQDYTDSGTAAKKLDVLSELNLELIAGGSQDVSEAWQPHEKKEPVTDAGDTSVSESSNTEAESLSREESSDTKTETEGCKSSLGISAAAGISSALIAGTITVKRRKRKNK